MVLKCCKAVWNDVSWFKMLQIEQNIYWISENVQEMKEYSVPVDFPDFSRRKAF